MVIARAPLRLSLFGGGTDYPDFFKRRRGAVLGTTIDKYIFVTINHGSPLLDHRIRVSYSRSENVQQVSQIEHPVIREALREFGLDDYLDIHIAADLPARTGLGSSSSFTVCFLHACHAHLGRHVSARRLADEAIHLEREVLHENGGIQDQIHAAVGGLNVIRADASGWTTQPVIVPEANRQLLESSLLLFYTRITRSATEVLTEQIGRLRQSAIDTQLDRMAAQTDTAQEILANSSGDSMLEQLGALLHEAWELKKQLSAHVSNPFIDDCYCRARAAGALGGKICGAGAGGFFMLLVKPAQQATVRAALSDLAEVQFKFERQGSSIIYSHEPPRYSVSGPV